MPEETNKDAPIVIDGREFFGISQTLTAAQDDFVLVALTETSALETIAAAKKAETVAERLEYARTLITNVLKSGKQFALLAGFLTEKGRKWTRDEAMRNAERFADVTDVNEKLAMHEVLVRHVYGFFPLGALSSTISPNSSSQSEKAPVISSAEVATSEVSI
jgi:hypothetical protein